MKLRTKIAGTVALPLALAIASAANAATVVDTDQHKLQIGGFVAASGNWLVDSNTATNGYTHPVTGIVGTDDPRVDSDIDYGMSLGTSRINVIYDRKTSAGDVRFYYEQNIASNSLRHAAIFWDGWVAGQTWNGFANLTALADTIDATGNTRAADARRNAVLGRNFSIADGMSVGVFLEDQGEAGNNRVLPDVTANFKGKFGAVEVFAATQLIQYNEQFAGSFVAPVTGAPSSTDMAVDFTLGTKVQVEDLRLQAALTMKDGRGYYTLADAARAGLNAANDPTGVRRTAYANQSKGMDTYFTVAAQYKFSDQIRANAVLEQSMMDRDNSDSTQVWLNAFYTTASGWEWGTELSLVAADDIKVTNNALTGVNAVTTANRGAGTGALHDGDIRLSLQAKYAF